MTEHLSRSQMAQLAAGEPVTAPTDADGHPYTHTVNGADGPHFRADDVDPAVTAAAIARAERADVQAELNEANAELGDATGWMSMVDPERPWLMRTTDGLAWIQCAECDGWVQADPGLSYEAAATLAELHRATQYPHVLPPGPAKMTVGKVGRKWLRRGRR